ncbi:rhomboid family intramembrane serine protease [Labrenzia sp. VG12]|uniref:rhomboid family intramembrane serine protease n=1 Tax=Labrenzia sp. VG12 TaxID=2021862 RepID=UPI000B8C2C84|nr:rhomboid family intramembrane serine protease [Labrenzia sp. VG12]ASP33235.1 rhomboid family intramembrane serine protease [Labrenzia sp. VG12]
MNVYRFDEERARREKARKAQEPQRPPSPRAVNLPDVILWLGGVMVVIHAVRSLLLPENLDRWVLALFAFWPEKYAAFFNLSPLALLSSIWGFVSYSLLHGGVTHIMFNLAWMAIFGTAVARRFGTGRFLLLSALCAVGGALAHLATNWGSPSPMIGASAAVSGHMALAIRFVYEFGGPLGVFRTNDPRAYFVPAQSLQKCFRDRQVQVFVGIWFGLNLIIGLTSSAGAGAPASVAWQAHIGGFLAGLALFPLFDPVPRRR